MPARLLFTIDFIEGYCSLGAEIIALRRLIPHVGSSIVVTAPTIGFFLLALALGYHSGSRVAANYRAVVARNFLISVMLQGGGLTATTVNAIFAGTQVAFAYLIFIGGILCPLAWLLGQTVPILTNLMLAHAATVSGSSFALVVEACSSVFDGSWLPQSMAFGFLSHAAPRACHIMPSCFNARASIALANLTNSIRDIEVINLDGLPEAEALRLLRRG